MSAIPHVRENVIFDRRTVRPQAYPKPRVIVKRKTRRWLDMATFGVSVAISISVLHIVAAFMGQLAIEQSRRAAIRAGILASKAEVDASQLRQQLDQAQGAAKIDRWAALNGMQSSYLASNEKPAR